MFQMIKELKMHSKSTGLLLIISFITLTHTELPQFIQDGIRNFEQINGDPNTLANLFYRANMLLNFQEFDHALEYFNVILTSAPNAMPVVYNKAYLLKIMGKPSEAIPYYQKVLAGDPSNKSAKLGLSHAYLATGNYTEGLPLFEYRLAHESVRNFTPLNLTEIQGKKIAIVTEAFGGLGDWMMMVRFAKTLKDHGAIIIVQAPDALHSLFSLCPYIDNFISTKKACPISDKTILLMNLPLSCSTTVENIPKTPYLFADQTLVAFWEEKIAGDQNFKIGLCWGEMPQTALVQTSPYGKRSMPLEKLAPLAKIPGVSLYSMQKMDGMEQIKKLPSEIKIITFENDFDESHGRFMDTAALMKNMDLIITLDTAPAHLAGALGITTWLYLPFAAEWRWMVARSDSPWYPTMRLFRQHRPGNWDEVVQDMITALPHLIAQKNKIISAPIAQTDSKNLRHLLAEAIVGKL